MIAEVDMMVVEVDMMIVEVDMMIVEVDMMSVVMVEVLIAIVVPMIGTHNDYVFIFCQLYSTKRTDQIFDSTTLLLLQRSL